LKAEYGHKPRKGYEMYDSVPEQYLHHRESSAGMSSFHCPKCGVAVKYIAFGHTGGMTDYECPACDAHGSSFEELEREVLNLSLIKLSGILMIYDAKQTTNIFSIEGIYGGVGGHAMNFLGYRPSLASVCKSIALN